MIKIFDEKKWRINFYLLKVPYKQDKEKVT